MKKRKRKKAAIIIIIMLSILGICFATREKVITWILLDVFKVTDKEVNPPKKNEYYRDWNYKYVKNTDNFSPHNKQEILDIYYTVLNSGVKKFTFYCPKEYKTCEADIKDIANNKTTLSTINNYVHPYNSFRNYETVFDEVGSITLKIEKTYSKQKQAKINKIIDKFIKEEIANEKDQNEQIKKAHDYIINNTKYDSNKSDNKNANYDSDTAYGALIQGYALCGGYSDAMAIILDRLNIKNFKLASDNHIWNAVYFEDTWYHLDLTWDDPKTKDNSNVLEYNFYMITTEELNEIKTYYHNYDKKVYQEL